MGVSLAFKTEILEFGVIRTILSSYIDENKYTDMLLFLLTGMTLHICYAVLVWNDSWNNTEP